MDVAAAAVVAPVPIAQHRHFPQWATALWPAVTLVHCVPALPRHWPIFHLPACRSNVAHVCSSDDEEYRWKAGKREEEGI